MTNLPTDLPARLRKHGLHVVEVDGWRKRGRPASTGGFAPVGVLCHHTASSANGQAAMPILINGRPDLAGPLCQVSLDRQGNVWVVAAGRANHAGVAKPSGTVAGGDGNVLYIGIEAQNTGVGEPWPKAQYDAYVTLCAALSVEVTGNSYRTVRAHKETSVTGKIDPAGPNPDGATFDMDTFRGHVQKAIVAMTKPTPKPKPAPAPPANGPSSFDVSVMSGRFDADDQDVAEAWQAERDRGASILLGTELAARDDDTLIGTDDRYGNLHADGTKGETAVQYAKADWDATVSWLVEVWPGGGTGRFARPAYARANILKNLHNHRFLIAIQNHDPAHLFAGSRFFNPINVVRWMRVMGKQARVMRRLRKQFPDAAFMVSGDFNANGTFLARYMATHFAGFKPANAYKFGAVWTSGLRRVGAVHPHKTASSDHAIQRMTLRWEKKGKA